MKKWVSDLSSTNFRIFVSILLAVFVVIILVVVGLVFNRPVQEPVMYAVLGFIGLMLGLDVSQFVMKRRTEIISPPDTMASKATSETAVAETVVATDEPKGHGLPGARSRTEIDG